jgi:hypothetical protein
MRNGKSEESPFSISHFSFLFWFSELDLPIAYCLLLPVPAALPAAVWESLSDPRVCRAQLPLAT